MASASQDRQLDELFELARRVCDGTIDETGRDRLEQLLGGEPRLRAAYVDYLDVNARLSWRYRTGPPTKPDTADSTDRADVTATIGPDLRAANADSRSGRHALRHLAWIAVVVSATAATIAGLTWILKSDTGVASATPKASTESIGTMTSVASKQAKQFVATLRESTAPVWLDGAVPLDVGGRVTAGTLRTGSGRSDIVLDSGVRLVVQGPADLALNATDTAFLKSGKVAVFVPENAIGFTIETPSTTLIDQGTEFGVVAEENGATEVHVFRGQVDLLYSEGRASPKSMRVSLTDKQARRVLTPGSEGRGVDFAPSRFQGLADQIAEPIEWPVSAGGNGHYYQLVIHPSPITWQQAAVDASERHHRGASGHLLTVTSEPEHVFVVDRLLRQQKSVVNAWIGLTDVLREGYFQWVTGEPVHYEHWSVVPVQQPDNYIEREGHGGEDYGTYSLLPGQPWGWNDLSNDSIHQSVSASIIEYEASTEQTLKRTIASEPIGWTPSLGGDGQHYRLAMSLEPLSWEEASNRASSTSLLGVKGHLAALETEAERDFVVNEILRVCGVAENLIGLSTDPQDRLLRWVTGEELQLTPYTTPNFPADRVFGEFRWLDGGWRLQTVAMDSRPAGWFGYLIEYPTPPTP